MRNQASEHTVTDHRAKVLRQHEGKLRCENRCAELEAALRKLCDHLKRIPYRDRAGLRATASPHYENAVALLNQGKEYG